MSISDKLAQFYSVFSQSFSNKELIKLIISNKRAKSNELRSVTVKPVLIKNEYLLSFIFRYTTKDITKNFSFDECLPRIKEFIENTFYQAELFTTSNNWHLFINKKQVAKLSRNNPTLATPGLLTHDKQKQRLIKPENNTYLKKLGITSADDKVKPSMQDKYKQINKYIEIIRDTIEGIDLTRDFSICDMGSGKGYLTFALYDYLTANKKLAPSITGVEYRQGLVEQCNAISKECNFDRLTFIQGTIETAEIGTPNILIALHACDTATDEAIFRGIKANSDIIICAPCCHKQIRKQLNPKNELESITRHGILKERQAEILTDTIRAEILEAYGYKTKVFEFISTEHTPKNVMIIGSRKKKPHKPIAENIAGINDLKELHGVEYHYLEKLLKLI